MEKQYQPQQYEERMTQLWEKHDCFKAPIVKGKKPFTILLPPPNANDPLHIGHALFTVEDILCRWHRMEGRPTLFLPGTDHAGIETQFVFEKRLAKEGKSRFDFSRNELYEKINAYVEENRGIVKKQAKRLGFSLDWSRERYTLEPQILATVFETFRKLHQDGLIYRKERLVNYCPYCGTAFSELEVDHQEQEAFLYYLDYGPLQIATTRPETIFADAAVAVHPKDKRYQKLVGQKAVLPLTGRELPIISDELVDPKFGTGALKITPGHDPVDFEIGEKHRLAVSSIIDFNGRLTNVPTDYQGLKVAAAREKIVTELTAKGFLKKKEPLHHMVGVCYRCKRPLEPLLMAQWFVKMKPLAKPAIEVAKKGKLKIFPVRFKKLYLQWLEKIEDWNISRQIVWGPRIPAWYCLDCHPEIRLDFINAEGEKISGNWQELKEKYSFAEIKKGLQKLDAPKEAKYLLEEKDCPDCQSKNVLQETDTFDTWFSSDQWPFTTLGFPDSPDFKYFYPTSVLDTMWDILYFWVTRMVIMGLYRTGKLPFEVAHMHCRVVDEKGQKMSKSKGNVINPMLTVEKYGADALRMALVFGASPGSDIAVGESKIRAMRNFTNKLWNIGRFLEMAKTETGKKSPLYPPPAEKKMTAKEKKLLEDFEKLREKTTVRLENYRFDFALENLYHFVWHRLADQFLEEIKKMAPEKQAQAVALAEKVYFDCLKLLHPFAPFVTEAIWQELAPKKSLLCLEKWPK